MARQFEGIKQIKRILDQVVREGGRETEEFREVDRLVNGEGWELLGFEPLGDHLVWILGKPRD